MDVPQQDLGERRPTEILRIAEVRRMVGLSRTSIWRRVKRGDFPAPRRLGGPDTRAVGWRRADIEDWLSNLKATGHEVPGHTAKPTAPNRGFLTASRRRSPELADSRGRKNYDGCASYRGDRRLGGPYRLSSYQSRRKASDGRRPPPGISRTRAAKRISYIYR